MYVIRAFLEMEQVTRHRKYNIAEQCTASAVEIAVITKSHGLADLGESTMLSSGTLCRMTSVRIDVSEEHIVFIITVNRIGELETTIAVGMLRLLVTANIAPSVPILVSLMMEAIHSSETSVFTRATRRNIP
jgi:hypothetical protein